MNGQARPEAARGPGGKRAASGHRAPWTAETVPPELLAIVDAAADRAHRPGGSVAQAVADLLNAYDRFRS
jgi:hypothetical protein